MPDHDRMFRHEHAHKLDDPERQKWLPVEVVVRRLALRPGMAVADVGAGTGYFALPIARAVVPEGRVFAVDVQPQMLERLRARLEPSDPIVLVEGNAAHTTLADGSVDVVLLANVWHEIDDHAAALSEATRVLRLAGRIVILDWRTDVAQPPGPPLEQRIAASAVSAMLERSGWRVDVSEPIGMFSYLLIATRA
jgi:ubiquinone/menaquinone biosynthesis C-methylase UbiE